MTDARRWGLKDVPLSRSVESSLAKGLFHAMTLERRIASIFRIDEEAWKRHANPWRGWTRVPILPLLVLAVWSRVWLEWWCLVPITALLLWMGGNPRVFAPPESTDAWMSKGVLGERVWLNREDVLVPAHHETVPTVLSVISAIGVLFIIWGLVVLAAWPAVLGTVVALVGTLWVVDRMV